MSNDSKYVRLYPERAVAPARKVLTELLAEQESNGLHSDDVKWALEQLNERGFPEDEPLFLLRGQDVLAPEMVEAYATAIFNGRGYVDTYHETAMHLMEFAGRMRAWQPRKLPD